MIPFLWTSRGCGAEDQPFSQPSGLPFSTTPQHFPILAFKEASTTPGNRRKGIGGQVPWFLLILHQGCTLAHCPLLPYFGQACWKGPCGQTNGSAPPRSWPSWQARQSRGRLSGHLRLASGSWPTPWRKSKRAAQQMDLATISSTTILFKKKPIIYPASQPGASLGFERPCKDRAVYRNRGHKVR